VAEQTQVAALRFRHGVAVARLGVAMIFDIEGFSRFFAYPDSPIYVSSFLNRIFECVSIVIAGGEAYWEPERTQNIPLAPPIHEKFLGDGAMYIWLREHGDEQPLRTITLMNRLWNLKRWFPRIVEACADDVPVVSIPRRIRFGIAAGPIYELASESGHNEYIGYCINLASRLQRYCPDLGFIASARLGVPEATLSKHGYMKVIATQLKEFPKEIVLVDKSEYARLDGSLRNRLFEPLS
jgi:class 3 adenylate cyclase